MSPSKKFLSHILTHFIISLSLPASIKLHWIFLKVSMIMCDDCLIVWCFFNLLDLLKQSYKLWLVQTIGMGPLECWAFGSFAASHFFYFFSYTGYCLLHHDYCIIGFIIYLAIHISITVLQIDVKGVLLIHAFSIFLVHGNVYDSCGFLLKLWMIN